MIGGFVTDFKLKIMAAADKTYINKEQYVLVKDWWLKTRDLQKEELGNEIWMYPFQSLIHETYDNGYDKPPVIHYNYDPSESILDIENMGDHSPVWNTSTKQNFWIAKNCPFDFIQSQIRNKLGDSSFLVEEMIFDEEDYVMQISGGGTSLYFWEELKNGNVKFVNEFILYGTTFIYKLINDFKENIFKSSPFPYKVLFVYCGLNFELNDGKIFYISDNKQKKEVFIPFFRFESLIFPEMKYSFEKAECDKWPRNKILFSLEDSAINMDCYESTGTNKRLLSQLPDYIFNQLK